MNVDITFRILGVVAMVLSPLVALQVSEFLKKRAEARGRRLQVFRDLMATRSARLSPVHVAALNSIEVEYYEYQDVAAAWRAYVDHLNKFKKDDPSWARASEDLFLALLTVMAQHLGFRFERAQLRNTSYWPEGFSVAEMESLVLRKRLVQVLLDGQGIPVSVAFRRAPRQSPPPPAGSAAESDSRE